MIRIRAVLLAATATSLIAAPAPAQPNTPPIHVPPSLAPGLTQQGRRIVRPIRRNPVAVESTQVTARVVDGIATTKVKFRLRNNSRSIAEKILLLPIPKGASADGLELWIGGKPQKGEVLGKDKARGIYQSIVASQRDPALLEYVDQDTLRLRVFPIPAKGTQDVEVRYRLLLPTEAGMRRWEFPCRALESGRFSIDFSLDSKKAVKNVWSPIQGFDISRKGDHHARASYESATRPTRDPILFYGLSDRDFGLDLLCFRDGQKGPGYFVALVAPKRDWKNEKELRKSIHFVLDTSGSMQGEKIEQARGALRYFLQSLRPNDAFNVIPFSTEARPFYESPVAANAENIADALQRATKLEARGGTNIAEGMTRALSARADDGCVPMVVFLTDGLATVGTTDSKSLLAECKKANRDGARVFVFGVGNDVNTRFLDTIADDNRGTRDYVTPGENLEVKVSALFEKLAHPVMSDLELVADGVRLERMVPHQLPDLFRGMHLVVAGRYDGQGAIALRLKGKVGGESKEFVYDAKFPAHATEHDFVATLWAQRRIGQLLDVLRLKGNNAELVAEVRRLGKEHGIVTPWTSQLVVEESERLARFGSPSRRDRVGFVTAGGGGARPNPTGPSSPGPQSGGVLTGADGAANSRRGGRMAEGRAAKPKADPGAELKDLADAKESGKKAVAVSRYSAGLRYRQTIREGKASTLRSKRIGSRVFHFVSGVWVDSKLDDKLAKDVRTIEAFSTEYFELLAKRAELAKVFAFSTSILVVDEGKAIQIVPPKTEAEEKAEKKTEKR